MSIVNGISHRVGETKLHRSALAVVIVMAVLGASGCATVTITSSASEKLSTPPTYEQRKPFFMAGLIRNHSIDVKAICGERLVVQMQTQDTFVDRLLAMVTLGVYTPRTARVWCS